MSYTLELASPDDISELVSIFEDACRNDRMTKIKARGQPAHSRSQYVRDLIIPPLSRSLQPSAERRVVVCAIDKESGSICGWLCWGHSGMSTENFWMPLPTTKAKEANERPSADAENLEEVRWDGTQIPQHKIAVIEETSEKSMQEWIKKMEGTKHMFISSFCMLSPYRRKGIGRALLQWGLQIADDNSIPVWVHASETACHVFARYGFEEQQSLTFDLHNLGEEFAEEPSYTYRYMVRQPGTTFQTTMANDKAVEKEE